MLKVQKLIEDAKRCEEAGAIALVLECVPMQLAEFISKQLTIPTIELEQDKSGWASTRLS